MGSNGTLPNASLPVGETVGVKEIDNALDLPFPPSAFPAWMPAVMVAAAMIIFLTASFYIRHRKVVKKREILMDYFYIIFQFGGLRRKRMVAALCNTNAITLRELGRSFMISFDSVNNADNSCPFFMEDNSAFGGSQNIAATNAQKKTLFSGRGMTTARKYRSLFRRYASQQRSDEENPPYPAPFHDILMKFKSKRPPAAPPGTPSLRPRGLSPYELQGSSMCTIHGDDFDYQKYIEENEINSPVIYRRTRRNAYVPQPSIGDGGRFADVVTAVGRHSLGNVFHDSLIGDSRKRNSDPCEGQGEVFQVYSGDRLTPPVTRNPREPTILVHSASTEWDNDGNGWTELPGPSDQGGVVFVRRLSRVDAQPGEYTYSHENTPQLGRANRAKLSKVSYVQSGNMNEYYNCLQRSTERSQSNQGSDQASGSSAETVGEDTPTREPSAGPSRSKRSRLSLGEIAVSNFNRRIDLTSESLKDYEADLSPDWSRGGDLPKSETRPKNRWARFKHAFSGTRLSSKSSAGTPSSHQPVRVVGSYPNVREERSRKRGRPHNATRWQKFVNVLTGFRSLPEQKSSDLPTTMPSGSQSYPAGLNLGRTHHNYERADSMEMQSQDEELDGYRTNRDYQYMSASQTDGEFSSDMDGNEDNQQYRKMHTASRPLRDDLLARQATRRFRGVYLAYKATRQNSFTGSKRYRKRYDSVTGSSQSLPQSSLDCKTPPTSRARGIAQKTCEIMNSKESVTARARINSGHKSDPELALHADDDMSVSGEPRSPRCLSPLVEKSFSFNRSVTDNNRPSHPSTQISHGLSNVHSIASNTLSQERGTTFYQNTSSSDPPEHSYIDYYSERQSSSLDSSLPTPHRPDAVSLSNLKTANGSLLSPENSQSLTRNSSESIYYDTLSSPVCSPTPNSSTSDLTSMPNSRISDIYSKFAHNAHSSPVGSVHSVQNPTTKREQSSPLLPGSSRPWQQTTASMDLLPSPDPRTNRRRSEEIRRPRPQRSDERDYRRRSATSRLSRICSSLITSTEVILVPMTISAPDSPTTSIPPSPDKRLAAGTDNQTWSPKNRYTKNFQEPTTSSQPSPAMKARRNNVDLFNSRLTVPTPTAPTYQEKSRKTSTPARLCESQASSSHELRRKSDTVLAQLASKASSSAAPQRRSPSPSPVIRSTAGAMGTIPPPSSLHGQAVLTISDNKMLLPPSVGDTMNGSPTKTVQDKSNVLSGEVYNSSSLRSVNSCVPPTPTLAPKSSIPSNTTSNNNTNQCRPARLLRQNSQDVNAGAPQHGLTTKWEPNISEVNELAENETSVLPPALLPTPSEMFVSSSPKQAPRMTTPVTGIESPTATGIESPISATSADIKGSSLKSEHRSPKIQQKTYPSVLL